MERRELLMCWISLKHAGQLIRKTEEPFFNHLLAVAEMAAALATLGYEIGLSHDLLEKTTTTAGEFIAALTEFGYSTKEAGFIVSRVIELTDVFTKSTYPYLPKSVRKKKEELRLNDISGEAQTVKYADLLYNIDWMKRYDEENVTPYLERKKKLIGDLNKGNPGLREKVLREVRHLDVKTGE